MAQHELAGDSILLFIDPAGGTDYDTVVCLNNQTWSGGTQIIDASSKCGPNTLPGQANPQKVDFDGNQVFDADSGKISGVDLYPLQRDKTTIGWKIAPVDPIEGDEILYGTGFIADLSKEYAKGSPATFAGSISVYGDTLQDIYGVS